MWNTVGVTSHSLKYLSSLRQVHKSERREVPFGRSKNRIGRYRGPIPSRSVVEVFYVLSSLWNRLGLSKSSIDSVK